MLKYAFFLFFGILLSLNVTAQTAISKKMVIIDKRIQITAEVAQTREQQRLGLGNRSDLLANTGMLFMYEDAKQRLFWMKGMRFNIDILWIRNKRIIHIEHNAPAPSLMTPSSALPNYGYGHLADTILEVNATFCRSNQIKIGMSIKTNNFTSSQQ